MRTSHLLSIQPAIAPFMTHFDTLEQCEIRLPTMNPLRHRRFAGSRAMPLNHCQRRTDGVRLHQVRHANAAAVLFANQADKIPFKPPRNSNKFTSGLLPRQSECEMLDAAMVAEPVLYKLDGTLAFMSETRFPQHYNARYDNIDLSAFTPILAIEENCLGAPAFAASSPDKVAPQH